LVSETKPGSYRTPPRVPPQATRLLPYPPWALPYPPCFTTLGVQFTTLGGGGHYPRGPVHYPRGGVTTLGGVGYCPWEGGFYPRVHGLSRALRRFFFGFEVKPHIFLGATTTPWVNKIMQTV
jgi:hypothetical protein